MGEMSDRSRELLDACVAEVKDANFPNSAITVTGHHFNALRRRLALLDDLVVAVRTYQDSIGPDPGEEMMADALEALDLDDGRLVRGST